MWMLLSMYCEHSYNYKTIIHLYHRLEINTKIVDQLYGYFKQLETDFIHGNNTIDEK
jgi:hypothetical protein